jgi:hypothetical protein
VLYCCFSKNNKDGALINNLSISGKVGCDAIVQGVRNDNGDIGDYSIVAYQFKDPSSDSYCFVEGKDAETLKLMTFTVNELKMHSTETVNLKNPR